MTPHFLSRWLCAAALLCVSTASLALNPATPLQDYNHAVWTGKDGAPPEARSMAQTSDGWLWMSSPTGLYRFDGVRFERYTLPGSENLARRRVALVRAHPNGGLWLSFQLGGGLSVLHPDGRLEEVVPVGQLPPVFSLTVDDNGDIWTATSLGAFRSRNGKAQAIGAAQGLPKEVLELHLDRYGRLWATSTVAVYLYDRAAEKFNQVRALAASSSLIESPDGRIWTASHQQVQALPAPAAPAPPLRPAPAPGFGSDWIARFDRDGNLWQLKCPTTICVTPAAVIAATDTITTPAPDATRANPASPAGNVIIEDREHNIWTATLDGLDRYRDNRLQKIRIPDSRGTFTLATDDSGRMWAANPYNTTVWRLQAGIAPQAEALPAWLVSTDRGGALMLGGSREIERRHQGKVEKIALPEIPGPDGKPQNLTTLGVTDDGKRLWVVTTLTGLIARVDGQWLPRSKFKLPPEIILGVPGNKPGQLWLASAGGNIVLYDENDHPTNHPAAMIGLATGIYTGEDIVASGDQGLAVLTGGAFRQLHADDPEVLQNISGLAVSADGDRWLNGGKGLVHVRRDDWRASVANPAVPLRHQLFGVQDGYTGKAMLENRHPSAKLDKDGQLWLATTSGMLRFDTRNIARNRVAPAPSVYALHSGAATYAAKPGMMLPPGAQNFSISYTAASLSQPEAVRFQYRLEGEDAGWQDAGPRRTAYYTNIAPGAYRFQVRVANEDGVWSETPAALAFEIAPTLTQTLWFKVACVLAVLGALYLLYLYRLRVVTARIEERMEVRLAERERIARTLHDTFLQSVQGVVLRLDTAVDALPDDSATRKTLAPILHSARGTIAEGRAQVLELRAAQVDDVESLLGELAALLQASYPGTAFELTVNGERALLLARAAEEIREIAREAVRNAFQHAQAGKIDARLTYGDQCFTLLVRDDGVGMPPTIPGFNAHFGLVGMRERAARIGGTLRIDGAEGGGVRVTLTVPARCAYAGRGRRWWHKLWDRLRG